MNYGTTTETFRGVKSLVAVYTRQEILWAMAVSVNHVKVVEPAQTIAYLPSCLW